MPISDISDFALTPWTNIATNYVSRMEINLTDLDIDEEKPQEKPQEKRAS